MLNANSNEIDPAARPVLDYAARLLREKPYTLVYVSGQGDRDKVRRQSQAVMNYLEMHGVPASRLIVQEASAARSASPKDESNQGVIVLNLSGPGCATCES
jgi:outer membrane protein OmpA-like peptidoglycan-associated protein